MLKKILMLAIPVLALVAGAFGGTLLKPDAHDKEMPAHETGHDAHAPEEHGDAGHGDAGHGASSHDDSHDDHGGHGKSEDTKVAWFAFPNQFFVPLTREGDSGGMMILTLSLETTDSEIEDIARQEHRLRDIMLRQLLIVANTGGFDGNFTTEGRLRGLRKSLLAAVQGSVGPKVTGVLIGDIARQTN